MLKINLALVESKKDYRYSAIAFLKCVLNLENVACLGTHHCLPVLWIRIRKFWLDTNPKKSSDTDSDPDTIVNENLCEELKIKHLKEKNLRFFC
jgi:hypothetical protein